MKPNFLLRRLESPSLHGLILLVLRDPKELVRVNWPYDVALTLISPDPKRLGMGWPRYFNNGLHINIQFSKDGFVNLHRTEEQQVSKSRLTQCEDGTITEEEDVVCGARSFAWIFHFVTHLRKTKTARQFHGGVDPKQNIFEYCRLSSVVREDGGHETNTHTCKKKCQTKKHDHDRIMTL